MSPYKEPNFFAFENEQINLRVPNSGQMIRRLIQYNNLNDYQELFRNRSIEIASGEASWRYLYYSRSCDRIKHYIPSVKLIVILRDPIERALSHYAMLYSVTRERLKSFDDAIRQEPKRINDNWEADWHYVNLGFYSKQLEPYLKNFNRNQIKIYLYEDFQKKPLDLLNDIHDFLEVGPFTPDISKRYSVYKYIRPKRKHVKYAWDKLGKSHFISKALSQSIRHNIRSEVSKYTYVNPKLSDQTKQYLIRLYAELFNGFIYYKGSKWKIPQGDLRYSKIYNQFANKI